MESADKERRRKDATFPSLSQAIAGAFVLQTAHFIRFGVRRKARSGANSKVKFFVGCGGGGIMKGAAKTFPTSGLSGGVEL